MVAYMVVDKSKVHAPRTSSRLRILVADDSQPVRMMLRRMLQNLDYEVQEAEDGEDAYRQVIESGVHMIVSDWMMPHLDGPALCRRVRQADLGRYIYFVLVSTKDSNEDMVAGMEAGADDFLTKPVNMDELRVRMRAGERVLDLERTLAERNKKLTDAYEHIRADLDAAARMQRSLLPDKSLVIAGIEFEWSFLPSLYVSGDELNYFRLDEGHVGFYNLDVAGHGVPAAMMSATLSKMLSPSGGTTLLKATGRDSSDYRIASPDEVASTLNAQFQTTVENSTYFTMVYGVLDVHSGIARFVQAGHTNPIVVRADGSLETLADGGPPIGLLRDGSYQNQQVELVRGDRLFVYSDGISECEDVESRQFGEQRLSASLCRTRGGSLADSLRSLEGELRAWRGEESAGFLDDVSILALQYR